ncbi:12515_t:CDS:2, partial [Ambispora leptoticha]
SKGIPRAGEYETPKKRIGTDIKNKKAIINSSRINSGIVSHKYVKTLLNTGHTTTNKIFSRIHQKTDDEIIKSPTI